MRFLRSTPTGHLLAVIAGVVVAIAAGTAIAVAATSGGPAPRAKPLASAVHDALTATPPAGITADVTFTNSLISADSLPGETADPLLQGTSHGRVWLSNDGRLRIELQGDNGDANLVVNNNSFWVSDPMQHTVYEGTLPADTTAKSSKAKASQDHIPTVADIQSQLTRLMKQVDVAGAGTSNPGDVAGRAAYSVKVSPKHSGGLLGQAQLAWDAATGVPLRFAIYARGNASPVLALTATNISYGTVADSDLNIAPPSGDKVVKVSTAGASGAQAGAAKAAGKAKHSEVSGVAAVSRHVPFALVAPKAVVGLHRQGVTLLDWAGKPAALLTYGQGLGGIAVVEQSTPGGSAGSSGSSSSTGGLKLPSVSINGATGTELGTPLGTVIQFTRGGVSYTVLGSVAPYAAESAARALTPSP